MPKQTNQEETGNTEIIVEESETTKKQTSVVDNMNNSQPIKAMKLNPIVITIIALIVIVLGVFGYEILKSKSGNGSQWGLISNIANKIWDTISNVSGKSEVLDKMPMEFSQIAYMKFDKETIDLINATKTEELTGEMKDVLSSIKEFGAFEMEDKEGVNPISFMLAKVDPSFDVNKAIKVWLINTGSDYIYKTLDNNILLYWTKKWVEYFENYKWDNIFKIEKLKNQLDNINDGKYNFALFTKPNSGTVQPGLEKYMENLQYGSMLVNLSRERTYGQLWVLFSGNLEFGQNYKFDPKLWNYLNNSSILFTEIWNLLPIFELDKEKLTQLITSYSTQNPYVSTLLAKTDYEKIAASLDGNIAISLTQSSNSYGLWLAVVFEKWDMFSVVNKLFPFTKDFIQAQMWTGNQVNFIEEDNKIWFTTKIPAPVGEMEAEVSILNNNNQMILQILSPDISTGGDIKLNSTEKTVLNFFLDSGKIAELLKKYSALNPNLSIDERALEYYKNTKVYGQVTLDSDKVLLTFDTKQ